MQSFMQPKGLPTKRLFVIVLLTVVGTWGFACSRYKSVETEVYKTKDVKVSLLHQVSPAGVILKKGYAHPAQISPEDMTRLMTDLHYSDPIFLWKEKDRRVFTDGDIEILAPQLSQGLAHANADEMIQFSINSWKKDLVFGSDKYTSGFFFVDDHGLNWAFGNVNIEASQESDHFFGNPVESVPKGVRMSLHSGQSYYRPKIRSWYEPKEFPNWVYGPAPFELAGIPSKSAPELDEKLEIKIPAIKEQVDEAFQKPPVKTSAPPPAPEKPLVGKESEAEKRLRRLKNMYDEKLISEKEYQQKKQEILKDI